MVPPMADKGTTKGPSERANQRLLAISGALGGAMGLGMALAVLASAPPGEHPSMLSGPLPAWLAIVFALVWGVVLPIISWRWHRVVDEHEREAYRDGAVAGFYVFALGGPIWWFLWRGGLAPAVDAFALYLAFMTAAGVVWLWRKYK